MITKPATIDELLDYWPGNIPFKGRLVSNDGTCMCAQGQALHFLGGLTVDQLRYTYQQDADRRVAKLFGISLAHSILLRHINDTQDGAPSCVIRNPEQVLGDQAKTVLAFWRHLDRMTPEDWKSVGVGAWKSAWKSVGKGTWREAWGAAGEAACKAAVRAAKAAAADTMPWAAAGATNEIQGAAFMRAQGREFVFLPLFGFSDPESVIASSI